MRHFTVARKRWWEEMRLERGGREEQGEPEELEAEDRRVRFEFGLRTADRRDVQVEGRPAEGAHSFIPQTSVAPLLGARPCCHGHPGEGP